MSTSSTRGTIVWICIHRKSLPFGSVEVQDGIRYGASKEYVGTTSSSRRTRGSSSGYCSVSLRYIPDLWTQVLSQQRDHTYLKQIFEREGFLHLKKPLNDCTDCGNQHKNLVYSRILRGSSIMYALLRWYSIRNEPQLLDDKFYYPR